MKKSLLLLALCAFAGQLAAADMPAVCEEYKKVSYAFIDAMEKQAKEFEAEYAGIKKLGKKEQEAKCNQGIAEVKELENMLKMMGAINQI